MNTSFTTLNTKDVELNKSDVLLVVNDFPRFLFIVIFSVYSLVLEEQHC